ncbi:hypothetical protein [Bartonella apis]|uniref:hypothetical protein n=1 Tax=Bartonella apis TaxID=1686310 RepID=UPI00242EACC4|nr:hypothetical protein [Bartonella apis]
MAGKFGYFSSQLFLYCNNKNDDMSGNIPVFLNHCGGIKQYLQLLRLSTLGFLKVPCKNKIENSIFKKDTQFKKRLHTLYKHHSRRAGSMTQELHSYPADGFSPRDLGCPAITI